MSVRIEARFVSGEDYVNAIDCPDDDAGTIVREWSRIYPHVNIVTDEAPVESVTNPAFGQIQE